MADEKNKSKISYPELSTRAKIKMKGQAGAMNDDSSGDGGMEGYESPYANIRVSPADPKNSSDISHGLRNQLSLIINQNERIKSSLSSIAKDATFIKAAVNTANMKLKNIPTDATIERIIKNALGSSTSATLGPQTKKQREAEIKDSLSKALIELSKKKEFRDQIARALGLDNQTSEARYREQIAKFQKEATPDKLEQTRLNDKLKALLANTLLGSKKSSIIDNAIKAGGKGMLSWIVAHAGEIAKTAGTIAAIQATRPLLGTAARHPLGRKLVGVGAGLYGMNYAATTVNNPDYNLVDDKKLNHALNKLMSYGGGAASGLLAAWAAGVRSPHVLAGAMAAGGFNVGLQDRELLEKSGSWRDLSYDAHRWSKGWLGVPEGSEGLPKRRTDEEVRDEFFGENYRKLKKWRASPASGLWRRKQLHWRSAAQQISASFKQIQPRAATPHKGADWRQFRYAQSVTREAQRSASLNLDTPEFLTAMTEQPTLSPITSPTLEASRGNSTTLSPVRGSMAKEGTSISLNPINAAKQLLSRKSDSLTTYLSPTISPAHKLLSMLFPEKPNKKTSNIPIIDGEEELKEAKKLRNFKFLSTQSVLDLIRICIELARVQARIRNIIKNSMMPEMIPTLTAPLKDQEFNLIQELIKKKKALQIDTRAKTSFAPNALFQKASFSTFSANELSSAPKFSSGAYGVPFGLSFGGRYGGNQYLQQYRGMPYDGNLYSSPPSSSSYGTTAGAPQDGDETMSAGIPQSTMDFLNTLQGGKKLTYTGNEASPLGRYSVQELGQIGITRKEGRGVHGGTSYSYKADPNAKPVDTSKLKGLKLHQQQAYQALIENGMSPKAARVIVANASGESLKNPSLRNWDVKQWAHGSFQWDDFRSKRIKDKFGKMPHKMSVSEQMKAFLWESKNFYPKTWAAINSDKLSNQQMMDIIVRDFERPGNPDKSIQQRMDHLKRLGNLQAGPPTLIEKFNKIYKGEESLKTSSTTSGSKKIFNAPEKLKLGDSSYLENPNKKNIKGVNPKLVSVYNEAARLFEAENPNYNVQIYSGLRHGGKGNHSVQANGWGGGLDFAIIDKRTGKMLPNIGSGATSPIYQQLHNFGKLVQEKHFPDMDMRTGLYFTDTGLDSMHADTHQDIDPSRPNYKPTGGGSWEKGFTKAMMQKYGIDPDKNIGMSQFRDMYGYEINSETSAPTMKPRMKPVRNNMGMPFIQGENWNEQYGELAKRRQIAQQTQPPEEGFDARVYFKQLPNGKIEVTDSTGYRYISDQEHFHTTKYGAFLPSAFHATPNEKENYNTKYMNWVKKNRDWDRMRNIGAKSSTVFEQQTPAQPKKQAPIFPPDDPATNKRATTPIPEKKQPTTSPSMYHSDEPPPQSFITAIYRAKNIKPKVQTNSLGLPGDETLA